MSALQKRYEKIIIMGQIRNKPFLIVIYCSKLVKAAMNAMRASLHIVQWS